MNTKRKLLLLIALMLLVIMPGSLSNIPTVLGYYNPVFDVLYAANEYVCLHEIAHKADVMSGWISKTDEWELMTEKYNVGKYTSVNATEFYANLYADAMGHAEAMPEEVLTFYDFGLLHNLRMEYCNDY